MYKNINPNITTRNTMNTVPPTIDEMYMRLGENTIADLFENKYRKNGRFVKYIYYGYTHIDTPIPTNENSFFVLIDTMAQTHTFGKDLNEVVHFLQLTSEEESSFKQDIQQLFETENRLKSSKVLIRKLMILSSLWK